MAHRISFLSTFLHLQKKYKIQTLRAKVHKVQSHVGADMEFTALRHCSTIPSPPPISGYRNQEYRRAEADYHSFW